MLNIAELLMSTMGGINEIMGTLTMRLTKLQEETMTDVHVVWCEQIKALINRLMNNNIDI